MNEIIFLAESPQVTRRYLDPEVWPVRVTFLSLVPPETVVSEEVREEAG